MMPVRLDSAVISRDSVSPKSGLRTVAWQQKLDGIEVHEGILSANLTRNQELVNIGDSFVKSPSMAADNGNPDRKSSVGNKNLSVQRAIALATTSIGGSVQESDLTISQAPLAPISGRPSNHRRCPDLFTASWSGCR